MIGRNCHSDHSLVPVGTGHCASEGDGTTVGESGSGSQVCMRNKYCRVS